MGGRAGMLARSMILAGALHLALSPVPARAEKAFGKHLAADCAAKSPNADKACSDEFVRNLVSRRWERYLSLKKQDFSDFCEQHGLDMGDRKTMKEYASSRLLHDMMKAGGVLGNEYVLVKHRNKNLKRIANGREKPIGEDASWRYPPKMARDLFSGKPRYSYGGEPLHSFGDCDEFEMAYVSMLRDIGMKARVVMTGSDHVNTLVRIGGKDVLVDNSFDNFGIDRVCPGKGKCKDYAGGKQGEKYISAINAIAGTRARVHVGQEGARRVESAIDSHLK